MYIDNSKYNKILTAYKYYKKYVKNGAHKKNKMKMMKKQLINIVRNSNKKLINNYIQKGLDYS